jgi:hypothetical protein
MRVSLCTNSECKRAYVRFRRDHPPAGFCSVGCKEAHAKRHPRYDPERIPAFFVSLIRDHLEKAHHTSDVNAWFDCAECDRIQAAYAESLNRTVTV